MVFRYIVDPLRFTHLCVFMHPIGGKYDAAFALCC